MLKTTLAVLLTMIATGALAQTSNAPASLDVAQQRARFSREQMNAAEDKVKAAQKKDQVAKKRFEEIKAKADQAAAQADQAAKELQDAQAEFTKARERHDQDYRDLKRAHDALQESNKQK